MHLERDQFVAETSRPVPRAAAQRTRHSRTVGASRVRRARQPDGHLHLHRPAALSLVVLVCLARDCAVMGAQPISRRLAIAGWTVVVGGFGLLFVIGAALGEF